MISVFKIIRNNFNINLSDLQLVTQTKFLDLANMELSASNKALYILYGWAFSDDKKYLIINLDYVSRRLVCRHDIVLIRKIINRDNKICDILSENTI